MQYIELKIRLPKPTRKWLQFRLWTLLLLLLFAAVILGWLVTPRFRAWSEMQSAVLFSRAKYNDYDKATYSFEQGLRDDPNGVLTSNDWDLEYGNGGNDFNVTMVTDDCSRIIDLGKLTWRQLIDTPLPELPAHPQPTREPRVQANAGHVYMIHTKDRDSDLNVLFRVESLVPGDRCEITWRIATDFERRHHAPVSDSEHFH